MKLFTRWMVLAGVAGSLIATVSPALAQAQGQGGGQGQGPGQGQGQGRPNFDPEQMRARMMERYRERLEIKSDDEWKIVEERITKVTEARREVGFGGMGRGAFGGQRPGGRGGDTAQAGGGGGQRRGGFGTPSPEAEDLQKSLDAKAGADEIKAKLAKVRDAKKSKEANLAKAQDELRKVLSVRQEAIAVMDGLLE
ncbi:MAG: hypothetical protein IT581_12360 [Verrucomicrobiales bacterium]|nr:hypothetical protein [Verrucomicrobiales bacterium]